MERLTFQNFIKQWWFRQQGESDEVVRLRVADQRIKDGYEVDALTKREVLSLHELDTLYESYAQGLRNVPLYIFKAVGILLGIVGLLYGLVSIDSDSVNPIALSIIIGAIIIAIAIQGKK